MKQGICRRYKRGREPEKKRSRGEIKFGESAENTPVTKGAVTIGESCCYKKYELPNSRGSLTIALFGR